MGVIVMLCFEIVHHAYLLLRKLDFIQFSIFWREGEDAIVVDGYNSSRFEMQQDMSDDPACGEAILDE